MVHYFVLFFFFFFPFFRSFSSGLSLSRIFQFLCLHMYILVLHNLPK